MLPSEVLRRARELVAGGWHEPLSLDSAGRICGPDDEGIAHYCLLDAVRVASRWEAGPLVAAWEQLEQLVLAVHRHHSLLQWLADERRTRPEVLQLITQAQARAAAKEAA